MINETNQIIDALKKYHDTKFTPGVYEHSILGKAALMLEGYIGIVRCGECRMCDKLECPMSGTPGRVSVSDFCSYGERK